MNEPIQIELEAHSPEGYRMLLRFMANNAADVRLQLQAFQANGITALPYDPQTAEREATISTVVRREYSKGGKRKRVIDGYIERNKWRFVTIYVDDDAAAIELFERHSGLKFASLPVLNSQTALERDMSYPAEQEVACRPFMVRKTPKVTTNEAGETETVHRFAGYIGDMPAAMPLSSPPPNASGQEQPKSKPIWWDAIYNRFINHAHFNGVQKHLLNAMHLLLADGKVQVDTPESDVVKAMYNKYPEDTRRIS